MGLGEEELKFWGILNFSQQSGIQLIWSYCITGRRAEAKHLFCLDTSQGEDEDINLGPVFILRPST